MIGSLTGTITYRDTSQLILDVHGVGYAVFVPTAVAATRELGSSLTVYTHLHVREDVLELYGFTDAADLKIFKHLISVSGVGCKTALGVFSVGSRSDILQAIAAGDTTFFTPVPRLGKKNAQKIIIELKNKLGGAGEIDLSAETQDSDAILAALQTFGYSMSEAHGALRAVGDAGSTVEQKVKLALKYLGK